MIYHFHNTDSVCSKARKILLYRRFYNNASKDTLLQLYLSLVRPHLEYASPVWNSYMQNHKTAEGCGNIFCMATKSWDSGYQDLLSLTDIIALEPRRARPACACCQEVQNCSWFMLFPTQHDYHKAKSQSAYKQATTAPTTICWYQCIFALVCTTYCSCVELAP